jgi:hypothetical protein
MRTNVNTTIADIPNRVHTLNLVRGEIMWRTLALLVSVAVLFPATGLAGSAPAQLLGKSVAVSWTDTRDMSFEDAPHVTRMYLSNLKVYISSAGRAFIEFTLAIQTPGGRSASAVGQQAPGDTRSSRGNPRFIHFEGDSLIVDQQLGDVGARRVAIKFGNNYTSCTASIITGKLGEEPIHSRGMISGRSLTFYSIQPSTPQCSISEGPAFSQ